MEANSYTITLGQYKGIHSAKPDSTLTEADIAAFLQQEQEKGAQLVTVEAPAASGDTVVIDFAGFTGDKQFEGGTAEGYSLELGSGSFIPGFEDQLIGASAGADVDVNVTFPENYGSAELAGQPALFKVKVHAVQRKQLPEINEEYVRATYQMTSYDAFLSAVKKGLQEQKDKAFRSQRENEVLQKIVANAQIELSQSAIEEATLQMVNAFAQNLSSQGVQLDAYLQYTGMSQSDLMMQLRPQAVERANATAVLTEIAKLEGLTVSEEEIEGELQSMADAYDMDLAQVKQAMGEAGREAIRGGMAAAKAMEFVMSNVVE